MAQSTKLAIYEERIVDIVDATKHLPEALARDGKVELGRTQIARLMGKVRDALHMTATPCDCFHELHVFISSAHALPRHALGPM